MLDQNRHNLRGVETNSVGTAGSRLYRTLSANLPRRGARITRHAMQISDSNGWFDNITIPLNPGLVSIIGQKGTGKSALAELIVEHHLRMCKRCRDGGSRRRVSGR
jgi:hypothetical protein